MNPAALSLRSSWIFALANGSGDKEDDPAPPWDKNIRIQWWLPKRAQVEIPVGVDRNAVVEGDARALDGDRPPRETTRALQASITRGPWLLARLERP